MNLSDENISKQVKELLDYGENEYPKYNSTSISHFIISASGYNGLDNRNKSIILLNKFNSWLIKNPSYIVVNSLLSPEFLSPIIETIKTNKINHNDKESLKNYLLTLDQNII